MSLIDNLSNEKLFTKSEIEVINFIKENPNLVLNMTIGELANQTFSSNTTIIRICKKLGFNGFRDFKIEYLRNIESLKYLNNETDNWHCFDRWFEHAPKSILYCLQN